MEKTKLTSLRRKLLLLLSENVRTPYSKLAKECRTSSQNIRAIVQSMQEYLIPYTLVDYAMLNQLLFKVYFKGGFTDERELASQSKELSKSKLVTEINELSGTYDLQVNFMAPNPSKFNKELKEIISVRPSLNNFDITINVVGHFFPSYFKSSRTEFEEYVVGGDRIPKVLDDKEKAILQLLVEEPKATIASIADKTKLNVRTVMSYMKKMESEHIIRGYKIELNYDELDFQNYKIILTLHQTNKERDKALLTYCRQSKNVMHFSKTVGKWDVEILLVSQTTKEFRKVYLDIREQFKDIIKDSTYFTVERTFKKKYVSEQFFSEE